MATKAKVFKHLTHESENTDDTSSTGTMARDIEDYITASGGTIADSTNLQITGWAVGAVLYTLVVIGDNS